MKVKKINSNSKTILFSNKNVYIGEEFSEPKTLLGKADTISCTHEESVKLLFDEISLFPRKLITNPIIFSFVIKFNSFTLKNKFKKLLFKDKVSLKIEGINIVFDSATPFIIYYNGFEDTDFENTLEIKFIAIIYYKEGEENEKG